MKNNVSFLNVHLAISDADDVYVELNVTSELSSFSISGITEDIMWANSEKFSDILWVTKRFDSLELNIKKSSNRFVQEYSKNLLELFTSASGIKYIELLDENKNLIETYASWGVSARSSDDDYDVSDNTYSASDYSLDKNILSVTMRRT